MASLVGTTLGVIITLPKISEGNSGSDNETVIHE